MYTTWQNTEAKVYLKRNNGDRYNIQIGGRPIYGASREQMEALGGLLIEAGIIERGQELEAILETYGRSTIELAKGVRKLEAKIEVLEQAAIERV